MEKYRKRFERLQCKTGTKVKQSPKHETPRGKVRKMLQGQKVSPEVRRKLLFGEVLAKNLKEASKKLHVKNRRKVVSSLSNAILRKYKCLGHMQKLTSRRLMAQRVNKAKRYLEANKKRQAVISFLEKDESSRLCAGKKETVTMKKCKKQRRLLNDTMETLHKKFTSQHPEMKLGYSAFCKHRPFWILSPTASGRNTCLCAIHENMSLVVNRLNSLKMVDYVSPDELLKDLCCEDQKENCLERNCKSCETADIHINDFNAEEETSYEKWVKSKVTYTVKGKEKICIKTEKVEVKCTKIELVTIMKDSVPKYMRHIANMRHQYQALDSVKKEMKENDILIHCDFSENYNCKYATEIQSAHFGGSKPQVSLHTVVVYRLCPKSLVIKPYSYCSLSDILQHDPVTICCHLTPVIEDVRSVMPSLKTVHFLSDGPTNQYRNRKMFYLLGSYLKEKLGAECIQWHYSEAGHGKGAPDGVGGSLKRTADRLVATGTDIPNFSRLTEELEKHSTGITILVLDPTTIPIVQAKLPNFIPPFKGTMQSHQVTWSKQKPNVLQVRRLSCLTCLPGENCHHYGLGSILLEKQSRILYNYLLLVMLSLLDRVGNSLTDSQISLTTFVQIRPHQVNKSRRSSDMVMYILLTVMMLKWV